MVWKNAVIVESQIPITLSNLLNSNPKSHNQNLNLNPKSEQRIPISNLKSVQSQTTIHTMPIAIF